MNWLTGDDPPRRSETQNGFVVPALIQE